MIKKIGLSLASIFLIWQSVKLLHNIDEMEINSWRLIIFVAWIINLFVTGTFAFSGFAFPTQKLLSSTYYEINQTNKLRRAYKVLRVNVFRKVLLATLWKGQKQRKKYFNGKKNGVSNMVEQSMKAEFGHLIPFIILCFISIYLLLIGLIKLGLFTFLINIMGNLYPIILQRHHRMRILLMRERQQARSSD